MNLLELERWAQRARPDLPMGRVIRELIRRYRGPGTVYSPADIVAELKEAEGDAVLAALVLLAGEPTFLLTAHWIFVDHNGREFELAYDDVHRADIDNEFFHPTSGFPVANFRQAIWLAYSAGPGLDAAASQGAQLAS